MSSKKVTNLIKEFIEINKLDIKKLKDRIVCFSDLEYLTFGAPSIEVTKDGKTVLEKRRPTDDELKKIPLNIVQIGCCCIDLKTGKEVKSPLKINIKLGDVNPDDGVTDFDWFKKFTGLTYEFLQENGTDLKSAIDQYFDYIKGYPVVIMKGDAHVIYNDTTRRLKKSYLLNENRDLYILSRYREEMYDVLGIEKTEKNMKKCSGELHTLLKVPMKSDNTHDALHDTSSMGYFTTAFFQALKLIK